MANVLFLSRWLPYPADNGSKLRIFSAIQQLARRHRVALVALRDETDIVTQQSLDTLGQYCETVRILKHRPFRGTSPRGMLGFVSTAPRSLVDSYSPDVMQAVREIREQQGSEVVVASQLAMVPYALSLEGLPALLEELELSVFRDRMRHPSLSKRGRGMLTWFKLSAYLRRTLPRFGACTVVSAREREHLRAAAPGYTQVEIIPNAIDLESYGGAFGQPRPSTAVFSGALGYGPNLDAMRYFLAEVHPLVRHAEPAFKLRITGRTDGLQMKGLETQAGVEFTGHVPDIRPEIARSWLSVVPLRLGGGTRLKILEAMALGTPVVSTSKGADGLEVTDGQDILLADEPAAFAERVVDLLRSPDLRRRIAAGGHQLVESRYDWRLVGHRLSDLVGQLAESRVA